MSLWLAFARRTTCICITCECILYKCKGWCTGIMVEAYFSGARLGLLEHTHTCPSEAYPGSDSLVCLSCVSTTKPCPDPDFGLFGGGFSRAQCGCSGTHTCTNKLDIVAPGNKLPKGCIYNSCQFCCLVLTSQ